MKTSLYLNLTLFSMKLDQSKQQNLLARKKVSVVTQVKQKQVSN